MVLAAPPYSSFSRVLFADMSYPMPARDFAHPHGLPGLAAEDRKNIQDADILAAFAIEALKAAAASGNKGWLEFPEDLGECRCGVPASLWQLEAAQQLAKLGFIRGALYQFEWGDANYMKPTGILTNLAAFWADDRFYAGWPSFTPHGVSGKGRKYLGPLPGTCAHNGTHPNLIGKGADGKFKTGHAAAYPPSLCRKFASLMVTSLVSSSAANITCTLPTVGGFACLEMYAPVDLLSSELKALRQVFDKAFPDGSGSRAWGVQSQLETTEGKSWEIVGPKDDVVVLNGVVFYLVLRTGRPFLWTSLQLHRNVPSIWHQDHGIEEALLVIFGDFSGGDFSSDVKVPLHEQAMFFCPALSHRAEGHVGDRMSLVAYMHPKWDKEEDQPATLSAMVRQMGFRPGSSCLPVITLPTRIQISREVMSQEDVVYIGRGHQGLGLKKSKRATPYPICTTRNRKKALKDFRRYLASSTPLQESLEELGGMRLACHCPERLGCHGDILIEAYRDRFTPPHECPPGESEISDARRKRAAEGSHGFEKKGVYPDLPSIYVGEGEPMRITKGSTRRLLIDGGGLCSLGMWPPWQRGPAPKLGRGIREQLRLALVENGLSMDFILRSISAGIE